MNGFDEFFFRIEIFPVLHAAVTVAIHRFFPQPPVLVEKAQLGEFVPIHVLFQDHGPVRVVKEPGDFKMPVMIGVPDYLLPVPVLEKRLEVNLPVLVFIFVNPCQPPVFVILPGVRGAVQVFIALYPLLLFPGIKKYRGIRMAVPVFINRLAADFFVFKMADRLHEAVALVIRHHPHQAAAFKITDPVNGAAVAAVLFYPLHPALCIKAGESVSAAIVVAVFFLACGAAGFKAGEGVISAVMIAVFFLVDRLAVFKFREFIAYAVPVAVFVLGGDFSVGIIAGGVQSAVTGLVMAALIRQAFLVIEQYLLHAPVLVFIQKPGKGGPRVVVLPAVNPAVFIGVFYGEGEFAVFKIVAGVEKAALIGVSLYFPGIFIFIKVGDAVDFPVFTKAFLADAPAFGEIVDGIDLSIVIIVSFRALQGFIFVKLEKIHFPVFVGIDFKPPDAPVCIKNGDPVNLAVVIGVFFHFFAGICCGWIHRQKHQEARDKNANGSRNPVAG